MEPNLSGKILNRITKRPLSLTVVTEGSARLSTTTSAITNQWTCFRNKSLPDSLVLLYQQSHIA